MTAGQGYRKAFRRCARIFILGTVFQLCFGAYENGDLQYPWGLIILLNYFYLLILAYSMSDKWTWVRPLYDHHSSTAALSSMTLLTILMGLIRQDGNHSGLLGQLGFTEMAVSWPFILMMLYFITILGLQTIDDIHHWKKRRIGRTLSHASVFIVLASGMASSADRQKIDIITPLDKEVRFGTDSHGEKVPLPFSVTLKEFIMEEHPPKLCIADTHNGTLSERYMILEDEYEQESLEGWRITVLRYLDSAGKMPGEEEYMMMNHVGATTAAYIEAVNEASGSRRTGWISCGSHIFEGASLQLDGRLSVVMPTREAESFRSDIIIRNSDNEQKSSIAVNHPAKVGSWHIYLKGYDTSRGKWSTVCTLECVKDGWYPAMQAGLWLILAGAAAMIITSSGGRQGRLKRKRRM